MNACQIFRNLFDPSSLLYGAVSLTASIGTIIALAYTVHSVNESKKQTRVLSKKYTLDSMFESLEVLLERVVFYRNTIGGTEIYFGKKAFYRAMSAESKCLFSKELNFEHIDEYVAQLTTNMLVMNIMLSKLEDERLMNVYHKKLCSEVRFCIDYVKKLLSNIKTQYEKEQGTYIHQLAKIKEIEDGIESLLKEAVELKIITP